MTVLAAIGTVMLPCAVMAAIAAVPASGSRDARPDCDTRLLGTWQQTHSAFSPSRVSIAGTCLGATQNVVVQIEGGCGGGVWSPNDNYKGRFYPSRSFDLRRSFQACDSLIAAVMSVDGRNRLVLSLAFDSGLYGTVFYRRASYASNPK